MYSLKSTDERNNAIDILKILSMVMVVLLHLRQYGIYKAEVELHTPCLLYTSPSPRDRG